MPRWVHSLLFSTVTVLIGLVIFLQGTVLERDVGLRWLFKLRGPVDPPAAVTVLAINSRSGQEMNLPRLPRDWPRSLHALTVAHLSASGVQTIVFDMDFSRPRDVAEDQILANAIRASGRTVLFDVLDGRQERVISGNNESQWVWIEESRPPTEPLASAARAVAPFPLPKIDQASHQFWVFKPSADDAPTTAAVAVQMALLDHHEDWRELLTSSGVASADLPSAEALESPGGLRDEMQRMRKLFLGDPDLDQRVLISLALSTLPSSAREAIQVLTALYGGPDERYTNFYGPPGTVNTVPYQDLGVAEELPIIAMPEDVAPTERSTQLKGHTVFVGFSDLYSPDQPDRFYTVFTSDRGIDLSGCEIMATAFANLLHDEAIRQPPAWMALAAIAVFGLVVSQLVFWPSPYFAIPLALTAAAGYAFAAEKMFAADQLWMPFATPLGIQLPFAIAAGLIGQYVVERRKKQRVGAAIAQYLPKHLAQGITEGRIASGSIDQVVHGVCLATDMSGFSRISETKSPGELAEFMNAYFETIAGALKRCEVDVTEFHADTIMCAWLGKPGEVDFRRRAIRAAVGVTRAINDFAVESDNPLRARVGLQDGPFYLGHTGGGGRLSYSILGNPANSASRLEGLNKKLKTRVLAAASVVAAIDEFVVRPLGEFSVVGKSEYVDVVEVLGFKNEPAPGRQELLASFAGALELFKDQQWADALAAFRQVAAQFPEDGPTRFFRKLCKLYVSEEAPEIAPTRPAMVTK